MRTIKIVKWFNLELDIQIEYNKKFIWFNDNIWCQINFYRLHYNVGKLTLKEM
jgi:hypothetical protein